MLIMVDNPAELTDKRLILDGKRIYNRINRFNGNTLIG
jgi:hypothetical protein